MTSDSVFKDAWAKNRSTTFYGITYAGVKNWDADAVIAGTLDHRDVAAVAQASPHLAGA